MTLNYKDSWVSRQNKELDQRQNGLRSYDFVTDSSENNVAALGISKLEDAVKYAEIHFPDGNINTVCHSIAIYEMLPSALNNLKKTGKLHKSKRVKVLVDRLSNSINQNGNDYHKYGLRQLLDFYLEKEN